MRGCNKTYRNSRINNLWSVKKSLKVLDNVRAFNSGDSFYFAILYNTLANNFINQKFSYLIIWSFVNINADIFEK